MATIGPPAPDTRFWAADLAAALAAVESSPEGLSDVEAARRLARDGPNTIGAPHRHRALRLLATQFTSPIILILVGATILSALLGDVTDGSIILAIILASGLLGFWQEHTAGAAVDALLDRVRVEVEVRRGGREVSRPAADIVVGDVLVLRAGDIVPADCRILHSRNLLVDEAALTGESYPVEKGPGAVPAGAPLSERVNAVFFGTHVVSGEGTAVVMAVGRHTEFGTLAAELAARDVVTGFERGVTAFGLLLVRAMTVLVTLIFAVNVVLDGPVVESLLFSLALAVGLTPQLLPAIVAVSLSTGARRMAANEVIVKRLDAIEDLGALTVLCTDKTGTLTVGVAALSAAVDVDGHPSGEVLRLARLNACLQQGFTNPLDAAILDGAPVQPSGRRLDEVPYDFERKRLSVLVGAEDGSSEPPMLICKGALSGLLEVSATAEVGGRIVPLEQARASVERQFAELSAQGYRVLGLATRSLPGRATVNRADEADLTLRGLLAFADPPKAGADRAVRELQTLGVSVRLLTGDNRLAARQVATEVGLDPSRIVTGPDVDRLDDSELVRRAADTVVFAEIGPLHKERIVRALRADGQVVGFLGDGINDAAALHAADVGLSVDTAADIAKQSASVVVLQKSLTVVADGIRLGRQTFANTLKYVRVTVSANFGNMLSMAAAAAFLPFLPLLPRQILLLNFLSDIPGTTISADRVDPEQLATPRSWDLRSIRRFMVLFGLVSSIFDIVTFLTLRIGFGAGAGLFRTGWFVESTATELAVMLVLRTSRPCWRSRPAKALLATSCGVGAVTVALPYSPLAGALGLVAPPAGLLVTLGGLMVVYVAANEVAKRLV